MTDDRLCPFCDEPFVFLKTDLISNKYFVECQTCFARGPLAQSGLSAFDAWKTRKTSPIATFFCREAALVSVAKHPDAIPLFDRFPGHDNPSWALGILISDNEIHYLRMNGTYK